ncbi:MAG: hypothetical protein MHM6MM_002427 [Cercozoa sp. M6MM]
MSAEGERSVAHPSGESSSGTRSSFATGTSVSTSQIGEDELLRIREIEERFVVTVRDPSTSQRLGLYVREMEKLQNALRKSHDSESRFVAKCRELLDLTQSLQKQKEECKAMLASINEEFADAEKERKNIGDKKLQMSEEITGTLDNISNLRKSLVDLQTQHEKCHEDFEREGSKKIEALEEEQKQAAASRDAQRSLLTEARVLFKKRADAVANLEEESAKLSSDLALLKADLRKAQSVIPKDVQLLRKFESRAEELARTIDELNRDRTEAVEAQERLQTQFVDFRGKLIEIQNKKTNVSASIQLVSKEKEGLELENSELRVNLSAAREDVKQLEQEKAARQSVQRKVRKELEVERKALSLMVRATGKLDAELSRLSVSVKELSKQSSQAQSDLHEVESAATQLERRLNTVIRDEAVARDAQSVAVRELEAQATRVRMGKNIQSSLQRELWNATRGCQQLATALEEEGDNILQKEEEEAVMDVRLAKAEQRMRLCESDQLKLTHLIDEKNKQLSQQSQLVDALRKDRDQYLEQMVQQRASQSRYELEHKHLKQQIAFTKQELNEKDAGFISEHFAVERINGEINSLQQRLQELKDKMRQAQEVTRDRTHAISSMRDVLKEGQTEHAHEEQQLKLVENEIRVLLVQLNARDSELGDCYEKLRLQQSLFMKGEAQFREKQRELIALEVKRDELSDKYEQMDPHFSEFRKLNEHRDSLQTQVTSMRLKVQRLREELNRPLNVHRWRKLRDQDEQRYDLIRRSGRLTRALVRHDSDFRAAEKRLVRKEADYIELRKVIAKQPGHEAREQLRLYVQAWHDKRAQHKGMRAELREYSKKCEDYEIELTRIRGEVALLQNSYFDMMRLQSKA